MPDDVPGDVPEERFWPWADDGAPSAPAPVPDDVVQAQDDPSAAAPPVVAQHVLPAAERRVGGERRGPIPRRLVPDRRVPWGRDVPTDRRSGEERRSGERRSGADTGPVPVHVPAPQAELDAGPGRPADAPGAFDEGAAAPDQVPLAPAADVDLPPAQETQVAAEPSADADPLAGPGVVPPTAPPPAAPSHSDARAPGAARAQDSARPDRRRSLSGARSQQRLVDAGLLLLAVLVLVLAYLALTG